MRRQMIRKIREVAMRMPKNVVLARCSNLPENAGTARHLLEKMAECLEEMPEKERIEEEKEETKILLRAIAAFGVENQIWQMLEELFELGLSICKLHREKNERRYRNFVEERADVQIMLRQMDLIYEDGTDVAEMELYKVNRLKNRMDEEENR